MHKPDRYIALVVFGAAAGFLVAAKMVPPDPVNEDFERALMQRLRPTPLLEDMDDHIFEIAVDRCVERKRQRTSQRLINVATGCILAGIGVMMLGGVVRHYRPGSPSRSPSARAHP